MPLNRWIQVNDTDGKIHLLNSKHIIDITGPVDGKVSIITVKHTVEVQVNEYMDEINEIKKALGLIKET